MNRMTPPPITREARDWLLERMVMDNIDSDNPAYERDAWFAWKAVYDMVAKMPLAPADPLDAVRARFGPKTRAGYDYKIFAEWDDYLWGVADGTAVRWTMDGRYEYKNGDPMGLVPASPHAALIAELRDQANEIAQQGVFGWGNLMQRAADALEKLP